MYLFLSKNVNISDVRKGERKHTDNYITTWSFNEYLKEEK